ncbi:MAG: MarR family transcriptional regulator [Saprospirales bacterium]|nr:MAG: MarR family transcriptional regulator [Saprospirales bacterium]
MEEKRMTYIQEVGLFFDRLGLTRTAGMVLGYLMSDNRQAVSFQEIRSALEISKGATSQNLNWLMELQMVEKRLKRGDRKTYYAFKIQPIENLLDERINLIGVLLDLFEKARGIRGKREDSSDENLRDAIRTYGWISERLQDLRDEAMAQREKSGENNESKD